MILKSRLSIGHDSALGRLTLVEKARGAALPGREHVMVSEALAR